MNSRTRRLQHAHRAATALAAQCACLACGAPPPSMPCHWPVHRGLGGGKAGWDIEEWVPLCWRCHEALDRRNGASEAAQRETRRVGDRVAAEAMKWRRTARVWGDIARRY